MNPSEMTPAAGGGQDSVLSLTLGTLETERLIIPPFSGEHLTERYVSWLNDPEVVRYSEQRHKHHSMESCRACWRSLANADHFFGAILIKGEPLRHIGNIVAYIDRPNQVADLTILIGEKDAWGRGYGCEAWTAVMRTLMRDQGLRKVTAGTMVENRAMLEVIRKSGMKVEGRKRRHFLLDGKEVDLVQAAIFASEFD